MRILVISDVHANFEALQSVFTDAGEVDETWCLGDVVGYGPDPNLCVEAIRERPKLTCLLGNHDVALLGRMPLAAFNGEARRSLDLQARVLTADCMNFLQSLPENTQTRGEVTMAHGSPRDPIWEYVLNTLAARLNFDYFDTPFCFVGHAHLQCMFQLDEARNRVSMEVPKPGQAMPMVPRAIFNPGSVGQPRDRDPRAAYAIFDPEARTWEPRRVEYNIPAVQARIRELGMPEKHATRIAEGW
jgi:diadenosine tetraphosphatase ApaH/serine/threonine PP2A family protein phosphatase